MISSTSTYKNVDVSAKLFAFRDVDIECLQRHVEQIAFCSLREEELKYVTDQQVIKLFRIAQLIIEYLLHSQDKLISDMNDLATKYAAKKR